LPKYGPQPVPQLIAQFTATTLLIIASLTFLFTNEKIKLSLVIPQPIAFHFIGLYPPIISSAPFTLIINATVLGLLLHSS
jgi:hypothetical protein